MLALPAALHSLAVLSELPVARCAASSGRPKPAPGCHATPAMLCKLGPQQHAVSMQLCTEHTKQGSKVVVIYRAPCAWICPTCSGSSSSRGCCSFSNMHAAVQHSQAQAMMLPCTTWSCWSHACCRRQDLALLPFTRSAELAESTDHSNGIKCRVGTCDAIIMAAMGSI